MISKYFIDFIVFSFLGWIYECIYCTIRTKHWQNRGFLFGPVCPIYGSGAVAGMVLFGMLPVFSGTQVPAWKIFLISAAATAILEYVTSYVMEKLFHARWWDYSDIPLNLNGRISLPTTTGFGLAGIFVVRFLIPFTENLQKDMSAAAAEVSALLFMAVFAADLTLTVVSLTQLLSRIESARQEFNERMETGYQIAQQGPRAIGAHMAGAALSAGTQAGTMAKVAAKAARSKMKDAGLKARADLAARIQEKTGVISARELHHLRNVSIFGNYTDKAPVLKLHDALSRFLRKQTPAFTDDYAGHGTGIEEPDTSDEQKA
ncbi:MAG: putative ABC transporter permease [Lachnospiraceae bacterium]|nr:putative ABC transporter permease [Lachnospiraceae bacterium]